MFSACKTNAFPAARKKVIPLRTRNAQRDEGTALPGRAEKRTAVPKSNARSCVRIACNAVAFDELPDQREHGEYND